MLLVIAAVDLGNAEQHPREGFPRLLVDFQQAQTGAGAVHEVHHHVLVLGGVDPDGLAVVGVQQVGGGHVRFLHLIAPGGHIGEGGLAVRPCHHVIFIAQVDAPDMEAGARYGIAGLGVPLGNGQAALVMVGLGDYDGLLSLQILGVDVNTHRGTVTVETSRGGHLAELVVALGDIGHGDGAVRLGFLGADHLTVPQDDKNSASQGAAALVHLLQHDLDLGTVLENQGDVVLPVPNKGLLHFGHIGAEHEALRRGDLLRDVTAGGELGKIQIFLGNVAAIAGGILADEAAAVVQLDAGDADDSAGDAHSGVVGVYLADRAVPLRGGRGVVKGEGIADGAVGQYGHSLGFGLGHIALRGRDLRDGVLVCGEAVRLGGQGDGAVRAGLPGDGEIAGAVRALNLEGDAGDGLVGASLQLLYGQLHSVLGGLVIRHGDQQPLHGHPGLARQLPGLGLVPFVDPQVILVEVFRVIQHQIHPGGDVVIGGIAGLAAVRAVDDGMGVDGVPVLDPGGLAVGAVVQLHRRHKFLRHLLNEALPVAVHIQDDAMFIEPAPRLGHQEPDVGPILAPMLQTHSVARVCEITVGVGVDIGEQDPQRGVAHLALIVPLLPVGPRPQGALLIGAQGTGRAITGHFHLLVEHIGQANVVDGAAGGFVADGFSADLHIVAAFLRDGTGGAGQARGGERRQGQDAHDAHQCQEQADGPLDDVFLQNGNLL